MHCLRTLELEGFPNEEDWRYLEENITTAMNKGRVYDINEYAAAIDTKCLCLTSRPNCGGMTVKTNGESDQKVQ